MAVSLREPLASFLAHAILVATGAIVLTEALLRLLDRGVDRLERLVVLLAVLGMTFLAFNEYLARDLRPLLGTDLGGLWTLDGQMNLALLLMVVVGFVGASIATREGRHLAVDTLERLLPPRAARVSKRLAALVSAALCATFARGAWAAVFANSHDAFEGVRVWRVMVVPINAATRLLPGEVYGPGTPYPTMGRWEDAQFDKGLDFDAFPAAFPLVAEGSRFPLWIPMMLLVGVFGVMALRFLALAFRPPAPGTAAVPLGARRSVVAVAGGSVAALAALGAAASAGTGWLVLVAAILIVALGAPLFVAVGVGTVAAWTLLRAGSPETVIADMFEATKKQELLAIPFFVLAGNLMTSGAMASRIITFARALLGRLPGGLGAGAVLACALFAAISGSSPVTVIAIGSLLFPMLIREGYSEGYALGVLTSAGSLGIIIPPSIPMIVYAIVVGGNPAVGAIDPAVLFKAGVLPGLFIASVLVAWTFYVSWPRGAVRPEAAPHDPGAPGYVAGVLHAFRRGFFALMLPVLILGGIYGWLDLAPLGIPFAIRFTVTEAAAVAVVYALAVEFLVHRELRWRRLPAVVSESAVMMGALFLILVIAISLNRFFVFEQIPEAATEWMLSNVTSRLGFLVMANLFLLALGCVMDVLSAILIVGPLLAPIAAGYGIDPIHFAIVFIVNLEIGYLTPPMGINLFVASSVFERPLLTVIRAVVPFLVLMLLCLVVIVGWEGLSLALLGR